MVLLLLLPFLVLSGMVAKLHMDEARLSPHNDLYFAGSLLIGPALIAAIKLPRAGC